MNKHQNTLIGAFVLPFILAIYCLLTQEYLRHADKALCKPPVTTEKISFATHSAPNSVTHELFFSDVIACSPEETKFFYRFLGFAVFICLGLATLLPCIILLRQRQEEETKLFE